MHASLAIGVDVGGTKISAGLVERDGRVLSETTVPTPDSGPFGIIDAVIDVTQEVSAKAQPGEIAGIGLGLPAQVDYLKQSIEFCTNLPLTGVDVRSLVMSRLKHPVTIDNDGNTAALGEFRFGAAKDVRDFLMVTIGTGVGGGLLVRGQPYRGHRGLSGELGHVVVDLEGPKCPCGGRGHLEAYVAGPAIAAKGREAAATFKGAAILEAAGGDIDAVTAESVKKAARAGDEVAIRILSQAGHILGRALVGFVNLLNPRLIVIGGGVGGDCTFMRERAAEAIEEEAMAGRRDVHLVLSELGSDGGVLGAAVLAFDDYDSRQGLNR
ncbi:MAG: ROK family protein [Coriobacteriia bacterium]